MCDFAPGERVVCVDDTQRLRPVPVVRGQTYVVERTRRRHNGTFAVYVVGVTGCGDASRFRRAEPPKARDIEAWLGQATKFEGPLRREKVAS